MVVRGHNRYAAWRMILPGESEQTASLPSSVSGKSSSGSRKPPAKLHCGLTQELLKDWEFRTVQEDWFYCLGKEG